MKKKGFTYIINPYTHNDINIVFERVKILEQYMADEMRKGAILFSPILHCHELAMNHKMPKDYDFWQKYCRSILSVANDCRVLMMEGWKESKGCVDEETFALENNIPVDYINMHTMDNHLIIISQLIEKLDGSKQTDWDIITNPSWTMPVIMSKEILNYQYNPYVEYENCGVKYRIIRVSELPKYNLDINNINSKWCLDTDTCPSLLIDQ